MNDAERPAGTPLARWPHRFSAVPALPMNPVRRQPRTSSLVKLAELGIAAPQVVGHRLTRMATAGPVLSPRDQREFAEMVWEKQRAFTQAYMGMLSAAFVFQQRWWLSMLTGRTPSWNTAAHQMFSRALTPVHRKATSNARRLGRIAHR